MRRKSSNISHIIIEEESPKFKHEAAYTKHKTARKIKIDTGANPLKLFRKNSRVMSAITNEAR